MAKEPEVVFKVDHGVGIIRLNRPKKFNGWRESDTEVVRSYLQRCAEDSSILAAVLTGTGEYFTAGADVFSSATLQRPSTMIAHIKFYNENIFNMFIDFPKPLVVAVNGPAVGMGVTQLALADAVLAAPTATFLTPFVKIGLTPEGCSTFTFSQLLGDEASRRLLEDAEKLDCEEMHRLGLVDEVVPADSLLSRAQSVALEWASSGRPRRLVERGWKETLKKVNKEESHAFGEAIASRRFYQAQLELARSKGKHVPAMVWWLFARLVPPLAKL